MRIVMILLAIIASYFIGYYAIYDHNKINYCSSEKKQREREIINGMVRDVTVIKMQPNKFGIRSWLNNADWFSRDIADNIYCALNNYYLNTARPMPDKKCYIDEKQNIIWVE